MSDEHNTPERLEAALKEIAGTHPVAVIAVEQHWGALRQRAEQAEHERGETLRLWREYKEAKDADAERLTRQMAEERAEHDAALERAESERDSLQRHFDAAAPEHNLPALLDLYHERQMQAERERNEARAERHVEWRGKVDAIARAERAEADNAALLDVLRRWVKADGDLDAPDIRIPAEAAAFTMYMVAADTIEKPHPGAALLELASLVRHYQRRDEATLTDTFQRLMNERSSIAERVAPEVHAALLERMRALEKGNADVLDYISPALQRGPSATRAVLERIYELLTGEAPKVPHE